MYMYVVVTQRGTSNEYHNMFLSRNKKKKKDVDTPSVWSYAYYR